MFTQRSASCKPVDYRGCVLLRCRLTAEVAGDCLTLSNGLQTEAVNTSRLYPMIATYIERGLLDLRCILVQIHVSVTKHTGSIRIPGSVSLH
jgi:hypothetical protein